MCQNEHTDGPASRRAGIRCCLLFIACAVIALVVVLAIFASLPTQEEQFLRAVEGGDILATEGMLARDRSLINATYEGYGPPLHLAAARRHVRMVGLLLRKGADPNMKDAFGSTPLCCALYGGMASMCVLDQVGIQMARTLVVHGADVRLQGIDGEAPLHIAASSGDKALVEFLLAEGAEIDVKDKEGVTALHRAVEGSHIRAAELLLERGADRNARDASGSTPLHYAARIHASGPTQLLLRHGVDPNVTDHDGNTPLEIARKLGNGPAEAAMREAMDR
ncbi:MAG: ankyrin repeat domain-containing protein [Candidatus Brocadiae bacterium]|nr:ankyrin repeat domain-containing protein [Candidatus Brocadiia bacterium]